MALGLMPPWRVELSEFDPDRKRLDITIDFPRGGTFSCPECGAQVGDYFLKYVVIMGCCATPTYYIGKKSPLQNAIFLCIPSSYFRQWSTIYENEDQLISSH